MGTACIYRRAPRTWTCGSIGEVTSSSCQKSRDQAIFDAGRQPLRQRQPSTFRARTARCRRAGRPAQDERPRVNQRILPRFRFPGPRRALFPLKVGLTVASHGPMETAYSAPDFTRAVSAPGGRVYVAGYDHGRGSATRRWGTSVWCASRRLSRAWQVIPARRTWGRTIVLPKIQSWMKPILVTTCLCLSPAPRGYGILHEA